MEPSECFESLAVVEGIFDDLFYMVEHVLRVKGLERSIRPTAARRAVDSMGHTVVN